LILGSEHAEAQVDLPRPSPPATVSQQVGLTSIVVEYSSPAVKGRKIWGEAVPYGRPWSMSPTQPTTIKFSRDVQIGTHRVSAGTYVLSATPNKGDWTIQLTRTGREPGKDSFMREGGDATAESDVVIFKARAKANPFRERLTFVFSDFSEESATLDLEWERVKVSMPIAVNTGAQVMAGIAELDNAWRSYANAARYMLEAKKDYDTGLKYADQSLALKEDWYTYWIKASLLAAKLDWRGARDAGQRAYQLGQKLGDGFVLEYELRRNVADWTKRADAENKLTAR
jgi:hypothetical protein